MKKALLFLPLAFILSGCSLSRNWGTYNVGVCNLDFLASNIDVQSKELKILAVAPGPHHVEVLPIPVVLKYSKTVNGKRVYVKDNGAEIDLQVENGELSGEFIVDGKKIATIHGFKGTSATLGEDGSKEAKACFASLGDEN